MRLMADWTIWASLEVRVLGGTTGLGVTAAREMPLEVRGREGFRAAARAGGRGAAAGAGRAAAER